MINSLGVPRANQPHVRTEEGPPARVLNGTCRGQSASGAGHYPCRVAPHGRGALRLHGDLLDPDRLTASRTALHEHVAAALEFELQIGPALVSPDSITLGAVPDQPWRELCQAVRSAAIEWPAPDAVAPMTASAVTRGMPAPHHERTKRSS